MNSTDSNDDESVSRYTELSTSGEEEPYENVNHYRLGGLKSTPLLDKVLAGKNAKLESLLELSAQTIARHIPFGFVERFREPVPEPLQLRIAFWSFPQDEEDIRLYACLANGGADTFAKAENLLDQGRVRNVLQVGFHLSAIVICFQDMTNHRVSITFDRRKITSCMCSCSTSTLWCEHVIALCLFRIHRPDELTLRVPVSESLQRLDREKLQKFAQYLINDLHASKQQILPAAQKVLDELLSSENQTAIHKDAAAPDPTAGATDFERANWCLDDTHLSADMKSLMSRQCQRPKTICSDIQSLHAAPPISAIEYSQFLHSVRGKQPEGLWNILEIVRQLIRRGDSNSITVLETQTHKVLKHERTLTWWFETKVLLHSGGAFCLSKLTMKKNELEKEKFKTLSLLAAQYSSSNFCDEIVHLWKLIVLNPMSTKEERKILSEKFFDWHLRILKKLKETFVTSGVSPCKAGAVTEVLKCNIPFFSGFKPALEACSVEWNDWDEKNQIIMSGSKVHQEQDQEKIFKKKKNNKKKKKKSKIIVETATTSSIKTDDSKLNDLKVDENHVDPPDQLKTDTVVSISETLENSSEHPTASCSYTKSKDNLEIFSEKFQAMNFEANNNNIEKVLLSSSSAAPSIDVHNYNQDVGLEINEAFKEESKVEANSLDANPLVNQLHLNQPEPNQLEALIPASESLQNPIGNNIQLIENNPVLLIEQHLECQPVAQVQNDDLQIYYMPPNMARIRPSNQASVADNFEDLIRINLKQLVDPFEIFYAKTEGLFAHGYLEQAEKLALRVAHDILNDSSFLSGKSIHTRCGSKKKSNGNNEKNQISILISEGLHQIAFICSFLIQRPCHHNLVFRLALFGLELKRAPAATKPLEVKLINQKQDLILLLKSMLLTKKEMVLLRSKAQDMCKKVYDAHDALTVLILGYYFFEVLVLSELHSRRLLLDQNSDSYSSLVFVHEKLPEDSVLGFQAALYALHVTSNACETLHPLHCEGIRRQRGELALCLLIHYKDDQEKLDLILENLIEEDVILFTPPKTVSPYSSSSPPATKRSTKKSATEAASYFMFELAKKLFSKAGGNTSLDYFNLPQVVPQSNAKEVHSALHMCSLKMALYSINLQNRGSPPSWMQRNYNSKVSFVYEQALEIGLPAIKFLRESWENSLAVNEAAFIADKVSTSCDPKMKLIGASMAKSCLKHVALLDANTVRRILEQCGDLGNDEVEEACKEIENANENVCANVLFVTGRCWTRLYEKAVVTENGSTCSQGISCDVRHKEMERTAPTSIGHQDKRPPVPSHLDWDVRENLLICSFCFYKCMNYVKCAWGVGMKAMRHLINPENAVVVNTQIPNKEDDVMWLLGVAKFLVKHTRKLFYLGNFVDEAIESVTNPYVLNSVIEDLIHATKTDKQLSWYPKLRTQILWPLIEDCLKKLTYHVCESLKYLSLEQLDSSLRMAQKLCFHTGYDDKSKKELKTMLDEIDAKLDIITERGKEPNKLFNTHVKSYIQAWQEWADMLTKPYLGRPPPKRGQTRYPPPPFPPSPACFPDPSLHGSRPCLPNPSPAPALESGPAHGSTSNLAPTLASARSSSSAPMPMQVPAPAPPLASSSYLNPNKNPTPTHCSKTYFNSAPPTSPNISNHYQNLAPALDSTSYPNPGSSHGPNPYPCLYQNAVLPQCSDPFPNPAHSHGPPTLFSSAARGTNHHYSPACGPNRYNGPSRGSTGYQDPSRVPASTRGWRTQQNRY